MNVIKTEIYKNVPCQQPIKVHDIVPSTLQVQEL